MYCLQLPGNKVKHMYVVYVDGLKSFTCSRCLENDVFFHLSWPLLVHILGLSLFHLSIKRRKHEDYEWILNLKIHTTQGDCSFTL